MTSLKTLNKSTKINMDDAKLIKLVMKCAITNFCESPKIIRDYLDMAYCKILENLEKKRNIFLDIETFVSQRITEHK